MMTVHAKDAVLLLLSSFQVSKLRSLTLEDNFNNTFYSKCPPSTMWNGIATNLVKWSNKSIYIQINKSLGNYFGFKTFITIFALQDLRNENIVIEMRPNNPFLIAGYHSPEFFCDRVRETKELSDALFNGRNVTLISPRRMGKTGLICHTFHNLKKQHPDIVTLYMDIFSTQSLSDFVRLFANTVLGKLDSLPQKAMSNIHSYFRTTCNFIKRKDRPAAPYKLCYPAHGLLRQGIKFP